MVIAPVDQVAEHLFRRDLMGQPVVQVTLLYLDHLPLLVADLAGVLFVDAGLVGLTHVVQHLDLLVQGLHVDLHVVEHHLGFVHFVALFFGGLGDVHVVAVVLLLQDLQGALDTLGLEATVEVRLLLQSAVYLGLLLQSAVHVGLLVDHPLGFVRYGRVSGLVHSTLILTNLPTIPALVISVYPLHHVRMSHHLLLLALQIDLFLGCHT